MENGTKAGPAHVEKLRDILAVLDRSRGPDEMNLPGSDFIR